MPSIEKEALLPSNAEVEQAKANLSKLAKILSEQPTSSTMAFTLMISNGGQIDISPSAAQALFEVVHFIADGKAVVVDSIDKVMTTGKAADLLNVSRPFLCKLLDSGEIPHHMVGRFRRVKYEDLLAYKKKRITRQN